MLLRYAEELYSRIHFISRLLFLLIIFGFYACKSSRNTSFTDGRTSAHPTAEKNKRPVASGATQNSSQGKVRVTQDGVYAYKLAFDHPMLVFPAAPVPFLTEITSVADGVTVDLTQWQVQLRIGVTEIGDPREIGPSTLDIGERLGYLRVSATFTHRQGKHGPVELQEEIYIDDQEPDLDLEVARLKDPRLSAHIFYDAVDDFAIRKEGLRVFACLPQNMPVDLIEVKVDDLINSRNCSQINTGSFSKRLTGNQALEKVEFGSGNERAVGLAYYGIVEDYVGNRKIVKEREVTQVRSLLHVELTPQEATLRFGVHNRYIVRQKDVRLYVDIAELVNGREVSVDSSQAGYAQHKIVLTVEGKETEYPFAATEVEVKDLPLGREVAVMVQIKDASGTRVSNLEVLRVRYDADQPVLERVEIRTDDVEIGLDSPVQVLWSGLSSILPTTATLEIKVKGGAWEPLTQVPFDQSSYTFPWQRPFSAAFDVRVVAEDTSGSKSAPMVGHWGPQVFNASITTSDVRCLFCHLRVEGDVAGLDFPEVVHDASGLGVLIEGVFYTNTGFPKNVPGLGARSMAGAKVNYLNKPKVVFPMTKSGALEFPDLSRSLLFQRVAGTLVTRIDDKNTRIQRSYSGNLFLDGTQEPFLIHGEVFIDGDVILRGRYEGRGTLYAHNIYIVGDLKAVDQPFPFSPPDYQNKENIYAQALREGEDANKNKQMDALHLGAITVQDRPLSGTITVGDADTLMLHQESLAKDGITLVPSMPYDKEYAGISGKINRERYESLGVTSQVLPDYLNIVGFQEAYPRDENNIEVNRVDAFLYGEKQILWYAYNSFVLNGGFLTPHVFITSSAQGWSGNHWQMQRYPDLFWRAFLADPSRAIQALTRYGIGSRKMMELLTEYFCPGKGADSCRYMAAYRIEDLGQLLSKLQEQSIPPYKLFGSAVFNSILRDVLEPLDSQQERGGFPWHVNSKLVHIKNPRTGLENHSNVVRYDFRLQAGGVGFESLRSFYHQQ